MRGADDADRNALYGLYADREGNTPGYADARADEAAETDSRRDSETYADTYAGSDAAGYDSAEAEGYDTPEAGDAAPERPSMFRRIFSNRADTLLTDALHGRVLSTDFFRRHWLAVFGVVAMLMIYITNRYTCQTQMETIQRLERDLEVAKTERVREKSTYMSRIRESKMQARVDSLRLGLTVQEQPPFRITSD